MVGGSWGATLALAYAETHPERVTELIVRGIFTLRKSEIRWFYQEGADQLFPDLWEGFLAPIPKAERHDLLSAYHRRLTGPDKAEQIACARAWSQWEGGTLGMPAADGSHNKTLQEKFFPGIKLNPGDLPPAQPRLIIEHMDMAKCYAGVIYNDTRKWLVKDPELLLTIYRAYNDFLIDELCAYSPDRIIALPVLPTALPEACPAELARVIKKGAKGVEFGMFDVGQPVYEPVWEPVWKMAAEAGIPYQPMLTAPDLGFDFGS